MASKGHIPWNKGLKCPQLGRKGIANLPIGFKHSEESKVKMSESHKKNPAKYWLGKHITEEMKEKSRLYHLGSKWTIEQREKMLLNLPRGEKHHNWKGGISNDEKVQRIIFRRTTQKSIFERDNYTCQQCFIKGNCLTVHHIKSWKDYPELRFNIDNCKTLCIDCHYKITYNKVRPKNIKTWGHNLNKLNINL